MTDDYTPLDTNNGQQLRNDEQRYRTAFQQAAVGMVLSDTNGQFRQTNKAFAQMTGYSPEELQRSTFSLITHPEDLLHFQQQLLELVRGEADSLLTRQRCIRNDKRVIWISLHISVNRDEAGRPESLFSIVQDITQDVALRNDQQRLLAMVEHSLSFMAIATLDGQVVYINRAGRELVGLDESHTTGRSVSEFYTPEQFSLIRDVAVPTLLSQGYWSGRVYLRHFKTGEQIPCQASGIRIDDPHTGKPIGRGFTMRDLRPELTAQEAQRKLLTLVDNSIELMSILELDGKNSYINKAGMDMLGFETEQQVQETPISSLHAPEHFAQVEQEVLPSVMNTGRWSGVMLVRHLKTGQIFPVFNNTIRIDDPDTGKPVSVGAVMRDMRPELASQQALVESEARFRSMIMQAPMAMGLLRGETLVVESANEAMLNLWGKDASVIGKPLRDALPELEGQPFYQLLNEVYTTGVAYQATEDRADLVVDGQLQTFYFNFTYKPLRNAEGNVYAILNMAVDVTHQVVANQQLKETEEGLREAVELAELATWTNNLVTGQMTYSDRTRDWLGVTETITPEVIVRCMHPEDIAEVDRRLQVALNPASGGRMDLEYRIINQQTGAERFVHTQARVLFTDDGVPYLIRGTSQDITAQRMTEQDLEKQVQLRTEELRKSNSQLQQSNQELERYAYVASHDLQEPLRKIQIYSGLLSERLPQTISPESRRYLQKIEESANRMSVLIKNILDFSRINHGSHFDKNVDLTATVTAVLKDFELLLHQKNARVNYGDLCVIEAVPLQLNQLFYNLIGNSLKFTREGVSPVITISCRPLPPQEVRQHDTLNPRLPYCEIIVSDNGIGFDPAFADRIFGLFQRLHHRQQYEGTGIGLALCQRIVANHEGKIWAESREGQGATFHILLPTKKYTFFGEYSYKKGDTI
ncbi:hypothetical protein GCM10023187_07900 [Nibrella viscosa]|uniref:histidine kinase n=1 Tax=Nibrella viscosa TaxID=1084524 RepID=A0ABP8JYF7_9BACT